MATSLESRSKSCLSSGAASTKVGILSLESLAIYLWPLTSCSLTPISHVAYEHSICQQAYRLATRRWARWHVTCSAAQRRRNCLVCLSPAPARVYLRARLQSFPPAAVGERRVDQEGPSRSGVCRLSWRPTALLRE